jgi:hypothetical protein
MTGGTMLYQYRLYDPDGNVVGEAHYAVLIEPGETIWTGDARKWRVLDVEAAGDDERSRYAGLLTVEAA